MCKTFLVGGTPKKKESTPYNHANPSADNITDRLEKYRADLIKGSNLITTVSDKPVAKGLKWETAYLNRNTTGNDPRQFETFTTGIKDSFVSDMLDHATYFSASSLLKE